MIWLVGYFGFTAFFGFFAWCLCKAAKRGDRPLQDGPQTLQPNLRSTSPIAPTADGRRTAA